MSSAVDPAMMEIIRAEILKIEAEEDCRVLFACESGSRAWGFASTDSDYDVRFVYVRPTAWYLSIQEKRDVIERPISEGLDLAGWDLPKALELLRKSNPPLLEWLQSPIVYRDDAAFRARMQVAMRDYYSPISCRYHYLRMARNNAKAYLQGEEVWTKKYFYVLRPVLACLWIDRGLGPVPMEFQEMVDALITDPALRAALDELLVQKRSGVELASGPRIPVISDFLDAELAKLDAIEAAPAPTRDPAALDRLFVETLVAVYGRELSDGREN